MSKKKNNRKKNDRKKNSKRLKKYPHCHVTKKISYPNEDMALRGVAAMWRHRPNVDDISDISVYECYHCKKWHIGHKSKYKEYLKKHEPIGAI